jgi:hypothetical protein
MGQRLAALLFSSARPLREGAAMKLLSLAAFGIVLATAATAHADFLAFDTGTEHACYSTDCEMTQCWGGPNDTHGEAEDLVGHAIDVAVGQDHTCTLDIDGRATCFGRDEHELELLAVPGDRFSDIEAGDFHTCGIRRSDSQIECWGWQRPMTNTIDGVRPNTAYRQLDAGYGYTCAVTSGRNAIDCWGENVPGGIVRMLSWDILRDHTSASDPERFERVSVGLTHFCFFTDFASVYCLGDENNVAQVAPWSKGDPKFPVGLDVEWVEHDGFPSHSEFEADTEFFPIVIRQPGRFRDIGATMLGSCALDEDGENRCWGYPFDFGWGTKLPFNIPIERFVMSANNYCGWNTQEIECFAESPFLEIDDVEPPLTCP